MFGKNVRSFVTECQRNPFQTNWNIFSEDDLWYLIVYPQTHASGNTPVRSRSPFWLVNRKDFTWGDHATLDFEETGKNLPTFYGLFPGFTYFGRMFCLFFFKQRCSWILGPKRWIVGHQDRRSLWSLWGCASCTPTSIQQPWRMGWVKVWMPKNAKLRDTDEILFKVVYIPVGAGICPVASWSIRQRHIKFTWCFMWEALLSEMKLNPGWQILRKQINSTNTLWKSCPFRKASRPLLTLSEIGDCYLCHEIHRTCFCSTIDPLR